MAVETDGSRFAAGAWETLKRGISSLGVRIRRALGALARPVAARGAVVAVGAGAHTVSLQAREVGTGDFILGRDISVIFVPSGSGSAAPFATFPNATKSLKPTPQSD